MSAQEAAQPPNDENAQLRQAQPVVINEVCSNPDWFDYICAENHQDDVDDFISLGDQSSTASLSSSVMNYRYEVSVFMAPGCRSEKELIMPIARMDGDIMPIEKENMLS
ncbi:hypothetical protein UCRPC4_g00062 [Phaeomoniella chlamydospora]|uniref:Uncharacterized protein n=1 Tax=Phaeomoniella chlamydospora TaxID=158046 RepID=A0A0G2HLS9_PHACM|nr:hypothetical protein UCRPC4_g00062 [Phaeomoniella chlamydospora]